MISPVDGLQGASNSAACPLQGLEKFSVAFRFRISKIHFFLNTDLPVRVYSPEPILRHPLALLRDIAQGIWQGRELAWRLFVRDVSAQYRQTILGYVWAFLPPMVAAATFIFLNSQGITKIQVSDIPYPAFAMMGTLLWQVFVDALSSPSTSLNAAKAMLTKINFPREAILLGGVYMVVFNFFVRLLLVAAVMLWFQVPVGWNALFFPVAMTGVFLCGFSLGMLIAPVSGLYGDVTRSIPIISGFWMLITPVVYPPKTDGLAGILATWNPISPMITTARESLTAQAFTLMGPFWVVFGISILVTVVALVGFRVAMPHLIARMGG